jgi:DNA-binding winged helix-turn-helix (wHTH) protein/TolB-like protein/Flp pilus assembly protein TadD
LSQSVPEAFNLGAWRVIPADNELCRDGKRVPLEPKAMGLLLYLAEHAGSTVSRGQLFEALWPGVVVSDDTLTQAVIKLRKALGDNAKTPRYIQTVAKRGYRLCVVVDRSPPAALAGPLKTQRSGWALLVVTLVILIGVLGYRTLYVPQPLSGLPDVSALKPVPAEGLPTLTVQPFQLLGEDASQAYLAQGLTFDLITDLSRLSGLWVIGSRSILGQKDDGKGALPVRYRVTGEVQRGADELRVQVHLQDVTSGRQLWSERYHQPIDNLFQIQEQISRQIAATLSLKVSEAEQRLLAHRYTHSVPAYELFLQAQSLLLVRLKDENEKARTFYRQAIALDPSFARAYAGLALSHAADYRNQWIPAAGEALEKARGMARTALQIDPDIPEVYWVLAYVSAQHREHGKAIGLLQKAISLDQSFADAYALMGGINTYMGRSDRTPALIRTAIRLNPDAGYLYYLLLGRAYFYLGDWEQALINLHEALTRNPANLEGHVYLAAVLEKSGDHSGALWEADEILALQAGFNANSWLQTYPMTDPGQTRQLRAALAPLGLADKAVSVQKP